MLRSLNEMRDTPQSILSRRQLHFRRHLAICALAFLARELILIGMSGNDRQLSVGVSADLMSPQKRDVITLRAGEFELEENDGNDVDNDDEKSRFERILDDYLPRIDLNFSLSGEREFENAPFDRDIDNYYEERFSSNTSLDELQLLSIKAALRMAPMPVHTSWGYELPEEQKISSYPVKNARKCAYQLMKLANRLERLTNPASLPTVDQQSDSSSSSSSSSLNSAQQSRSFSSASPVDNYEAQLLYKSRDIQFARYLDSFGRVPSDLLRGNTRWYGSRAACLDTRLYDNDNIADTTLLRDQQQQQQQQLMGVAGGISETRKSKGRGELIKFRYCMAAMRSSGWPAKPANRTKVQLASSWKELGVGSNDFNLGNFFFRIGVCLPEACDSSAFEEAPDSQRIIERLAKFNLMRPFNSDHYYLDELYCLPDERSPLRSIPLLGKLLLLATFAWLALISIATTVDLNVQRFYTYAVKEIRRKRKHEASYTTTGNSSSMTKTANLQNNELKESDLFGIKSGWIKLNVYLWDTSKKLSPRLDLIESLSLYSNWLRYTKKVKLAVAELHSEEQRRERIRLKNKRLVEKARLEKSTIIVNGDEGEAAGKRAGVENDELEQKLNDRLDAMDEEDEEQADQVKSRVDLSSLNALKVIAMMWIIAGHCIFYLGSTLSNGALLKLYMRRVPTFLLANGAIYITEIFFVITGCLTAYLGFKYNTMKSSGGRISLKERTFKLSFWFVVTINRYLRIMPTYLVVYAFVKLVSVYVGGSGQLWDYAVSSNSFRRTCVQESWLPVLTLTSNFLDLYQHCIVGGWYLSVDMQFMVTAIPLLLLLAHSMRRKQKPAEASKQQQQLTFIHTSQSKSLDEEENSASSTEKDDSKKELSDVREEKATGIPIDSGEGGKAGIGSGYLLVLATCLMSMLASIVYGIIQRKVDLSHLLKFAPHTISVLSKSFNMYTNPVFRFRAFTLGLIVGHLLYLYEFGLIRLPKFIQQHGAKLSVSIFSIGSCVMILPVLYPAEKFVISHDITVILMILSATGIDLFLCALIFLICIGKTPKVVMLVLNSPFWSLLSSLSLSAFLLHTEIIVLLTSQLNPPPSVQYSLLLFVFSAVLILTYTLALGLYLAFEMPVGRLVESLSRIYLGRLKETSINDENKQRRSRGDLSNKLDPTRTELSKMKSPQTESSDTKTSSEL